MSNPSASGTESPSQMTQGDSRQSDASCDLCGLPARSNASTLESSGETFHFCCMGCRQVFRMLMEASADPDPACFKQTELFRKCREMGIIPASESDLPGPGYQRNEKALDPPPDGHVLELNLDISDMWCPACAWVVEEGLRKMDGVKSAACSFSTDRLRIGYDPVVTSPSRMMARIGSLGYGATIRGEGGDPKGSKQEVVRLAVSVFLTLNIMTLSFALYTGFFTEFSRETVFKLSWPLFAMATLVLFYGGRQIYRRAAAGIANAGFSMETLITVGSFSAFLYSTFNLFSGSIELYYDTSSMLITLVLLGKGIERKAKDRIKGDLGNFFSLRPAKVRIRSKLCPEGRFVSAEHLQKGDVFRVEEGEVISADGTILKGKGLVDESSLTGEPLPVKKKQGDRLKSGTRVKTGSFNVKAEAVGVHSTLGRMIRIMEKALGSRTRIEGKTDLVLKWFVPTILLLATGTGLVCYFLGLTPGEALIRAVTVTVISCPCALGVAVPLARVAGISMAGKKGLLVHDFSAFEKAEGLDTIVFDKTGTLTKGQWTLVRILPFDGFTQEEILSLATSLEQSSDHYIGLEIKRTARERGVSPALLSRIRVFDNGISGKSERGMVKIGARAFVLDEIDGTGLPLENGLEDRNGPEISRVFMSVGGKPCAVLEFGDRIKAGAAETVQKLGSMEKRIAMVSGDLDSTTRTVGKKVGIDPSFGGKLPQEKAAFVKALQDENHRVAMVGDGINDAPALVQADLSMAVHSGVHLGDGSADITLLRGDPEQVPEFLVLARRVNRKIRENLFFSFLYNAISIPIAMSGLLTPIVAVCAMLLSSLSVIGNTLLLMKRVS